MLNDMPVDGPPGRFVGVTRESKDVHGLAAHELCEHNEHDE
jgi:hypothetical protein